MILLCYVLEILINNIINRLRTRETRCRVRAGDGAPVFLTDEAASRVRLLARCAKAKTTTTRPCDTPVAAIHLFVEKSLVSRLIKSPLLATATNGPNTDAVGRDLRSGQIRKGPPE